MKGLCVGVVSFVVLLVNAGQFEDGMRLLDLKAYSRAEAAFRRSAAEGNPAAERQLGFLYYKGFGVKQDNALAVSWFEKAATHGDLESQVNLGQMYENGLFVVQSDALSAKWFRMAAEQDHRRSQLRMGEISYLGAGVSRDHAEAVKWWQLAMRANDHEAMQMRAMVQAAMNRIPPETTADGQRRASEWLGARAR